MCQRVVCQKREFAVRLSSCEVLTIIFCENRHEAFILLKLLFAMDFSVVETVAVCQKIIHLYA